MTTPSTHDFLNALDLGDEADIRDIRLAYARKLKQLDLAAAPAAFRALRDTYEAALAWAQDGAGNAPAASARSAATFALSPASVPAGDANKQDEKPKESLNARPDPASEAQRPATVNERLAAPMLPSAGSDNTTRSGTAFEGSRPLLKTGAAAAPAWNARIVSLILALLMLGFACVLLLHPVKAAPMQAEATTPAQEEARLVPFGETDPTSDELAQRLPPIRYQPAASGGAELVVVYFIVLRPADMKVSFMSTETESGDPAFDEAVKEAVLAAKPFARGTSYSFTASFRGRFEDAAAPGTQGGRTFVVTPTVPPNDSPLNMPRKLP